VNADEVQRLQRLYADWADDELRAVANQPEGYTEEARSVARSILVTRGVPTELAPETPASPERTYEPGTCHACGSSTGVNCVPFIFARSERNWTPTVASVALSAVTLAIAGGFVILKPTRRLCSPIARTLLICDDCYDRWADRKGWLTAGAYCFHPEYASLEAKGFDSIVDEREFSKSKFF
jgi:hypothetical protein